MQLRIIEPKPGDLFIIDETESPIAVGRADNLCDVIERIGKLTGVKIIVEQCSGDYLYSILSERGITTPQVETPTSPTPIGEVCPNHKPYEPCVWGGAVGCPEKPCICEDRANAFRS